MHRRDTEKQITKKTAYDAQKKQKRTEKTIDDRNDSTIDGSQIAQTVYDKAQTSEMMVSLNNVQYQSLEICLTH